MSTDIEKIKKIVMNDTIVDAFELPQYKKSANSAVATNVEKILEDFNNQDADTGYDHYILKVKKSNLTPNKPEVTLSSLVNETLEIGEKITQKRQAPQDPKDSDDTYDPQFLLANAELLERNREFTLARNIYYALVKKGQLIPASLSGIARTLEFDGNLDESIYYYKEAIAYSSEITFYQSLAALQIRTGKDRDALETLIRALGLHGISKHNKFDFHKSIGNCYTRLEEYEKAEYHYLKAYEINPNSDVLQVNVGSLALQKKQYEAALKHFNKALEINPKNDRALSGLGMLYMQEKNMHKAVALFSESLNININNLGTIYNLVKCSYECKEFKKAAIILKNYLALYPFNLTATYSYAGILFHLNAHDESKEQISKILKSDPTHTGAKELLDLINKKSGGVKA